MKVWGTVTAMLAAAALTLAAPAAAEDTFYFDNATGVGFTGTMTPAESECWFGATGLFVSSPNPSLAGSLRSDMSPFNNCLEEIWDPFLAYDQTMFGSYTEEGFTKYLFSGGVGALDFLASDPLIGSASLDCGTQGAEWEEGAGYTPIEPYMTTEVDGTTCTVRWVPGRAPGAKASASAAPRTATHLRLVDSLARVERGSAQVEAEAFGARDRVVRAGVVLRAASGGELGHGTALLRGGAKPRLIAVPLSASARRALAGKHAELRGVRAVLTHADGSPGSGDATAQLVLRR